LHDAADRFTEPNRGPSRGTKHIPGPPPVIRINDLSPHKTKQVVGQVTPEDPAGDQALQDEVPLTDDVMDRMEAPIQPPSSTAAFIVGNVDDRGFRIEYEVAVPR
jgi:hypothetical protein